MSAGLLEVRGSQTPRIMTTPAYHSTIGPQVVDLAALAGLYLDPWQQLVIEHMFGRRADGTLASSEVAVIVARQNGKGAIIEAAQLAWLFLLDEPLIVYTAHEVKTANEMFMRIKALIDGAPKLSRRCLPARNSNGQQAIRTRSGQRLNFLARSSGSGRGFSAPRLLLDEAMFLDERHTAAVGPTLLAMRDPQIGYFSSAPRAEDLVLNALCDRGEAGTSPRLSYFEWSARKGRAWDDREGWAEALPAWGYRLTEEKVLEQLGICGGEKPFMREILSIREDSAAGGALDPARWATLLDPESQTAGRVAFAVDVPPDRSAAVISVGGQRADGLHHVEVIDVRPGTDWVPARLVELKAAHRPVGFVIDKASPAGSLIPDCEAAGLKILSPTSQQLGAACGDFADCVTEGTLRHPADVELDAAVKGATKRDIGDGGFAWARKNLTINISFLVSATLALWGYKANKKKVFDIDKAIPSNQAVITAGEDHGDLLPPPEA